MVRNVIGEEKKFCNIDSDMKITGAITPTENFPGKQYDNLPEKLWLGQCHKTFCGQLS